jgi:DNA-binding IclR family transcriptional regulator
MAGDVPAVSNAVRLLERIARDWPEPVSSGTLIEELGLNRSTAYGILGTLQRAGWAATNGGRAGWSLGPRLLAIAPAAEDRLAAIVREELNEATRKLGFLAFAARRNTDDGYTVIARAERGKGIHISVGVGDTFPFAAPAIMRAFHAWGDSQTIDGHKLPAFTPETITDPDDLRAEFARTRDRGYGVSIREYDLGQSGIAAPVFDESGRVALVLCALAFSSELNENSVDRYGPILRDCALRITERTGGVWPRP